MNTGSRLMASITFLLLLTLLLQVTPLGTGGVEASAFQRRGQGETSVQKSRANKLSAIDAATAEGILSAKGGKERAAQAPGRVRQGSKYYDALGIEFDSVAARQNFRAPGTKVFTSFGRFADIFADTAYNRETDDYVIAPGVMEAIQNNPHVVMFELLRTVEAPPPPPATLKPLTRQIPDQIVRGGYNGLTGKGVTIAVIDSGLDFRNPDFITYDSAGRPTSRLLYLWDTTASDYDAQRIGSKSPISFPNGSSVGTLYTRDQLTAELRSATKRIPATDLNGHGTACAGVAAGNGNNGKDRPEVVGVAPQADLIGVRIGGSAAGFFENAYMLNAILGWLDSLPELQSKPLVVSCSFGGQVYGHDGNTIEERELSARFNADRKGRAIAIAAGNEGGDKIHSEVRLAGEANKAHVTWDRTSERGGYLELYFDNTACDDIKIIPDTQTNTRIKVYDFYVNPISKKCETAVGVSPGRGGLYLYTLSGRAVVADLYAHSLLFSSESATYSKLIGIPGTASNAITVGSYDWNDVFKGFSVKDFCRGSDNLTIGGISCYSSIGYSRSGAVKPEIVAPGEIYHASYAKLPDGSGTIPEECSSASGNGCTPQMFRERFIDASGNYQLFNGTSAATPYTAGIIALMFERKPRLTFGEVRNLLTRSATSDTFTSQVPNIKWGYGKLNLAAVQRLFSAIGTPLAR